MTLKLALYFSFALFACAELKISYEGYSVYQITPKTEEHLEALQVIQKNRLAEYWDDEYAVNFQVQAMVSQDNKDNFLKALETVKMESKLMINDLNQVINDQLKPSRVNTHSFLSYNWYSYQSLEQINFWLDELVATYPDIVSPVVMGRSVENKEIRGIKIDYHPERNETLIGVLEGALHAREWISPATVTWIVKEFLTSTDPEVRALAENIQWHVFPVVNPDGYTYTFRSNRMWRKNRGKTSSQSCAHAGVEDDMSNGVDLNRNFDFHWMSVGASNDSCFNTFAGPSPASEPETRAIVEYVTDLKQRGRIIYYLSFHSYTQLFIIPYSHVQSIEEFEPDNYADMFEIATRSAEKLKERYGTTYRVGIAADILYPMGGSSFDWVKYSANVPVSYLIELRDLGEYGFLLPPDQIVPNNLEIMDALLEMDRTTRRLGYYHSGAQTIICSFVSYKDFKVYKVTPQSERDVEHLTKLDATNEFMFWKDVTKVGGDVKIMVDPKKTAKFEKYMEDIDLKFEVVVDDVQSVIDEQIKRPTNARNAQGYSWNYYQTFDEILEWMENIVNEHSDVASLVTIGQSVEGRPIRGVVIDFKKRDNPLIGMLEGGIHAREWISPATLTWVIKEFLTSTDENVRQLAETFQWHIFPVVNPDGYSYTFTNDRMWRKNRSQANFMSCSQWNLNDDMSNGIDLNRNFGFLWMTVGASNLACSEVYAGPNAFSEPESLAIINYVLALQQQGTLLYYVAFHSYSQMFLVPYSHVGGSQVLEAPNYGDMFEIAIKSAEKLEQRHHTEYTVGTSVDILYPVSGSSFDWVKGVAGVPIVYLIELRDVGEYGFLLPPSLIIPNNQEIVDALVEMDRVTRELHYYHSSGSIVKISFGLLSVVMLKYFL
ncbi:uncharacterized protein LOC121726137 [Aricia agestis]|uniref:uncharacterized protein LOC121726137 n=1 Tax=Aricia agestis TaxID=91739 RepID=UPI001C2031B1|nr:uncharacterized protein LOC121726137 [Aricia agestis]